MVTSKDSEKRRKKIRMFKGITKGNFLHVDGSLRISGTELHRVFDNWCPGSIPNFSQVCRPPAHPRLLVHCLRKPETSAPRHSPRGMPKKAPLLCTVGIAV